MPRGRPRNQQNQNELEMTAEDIHDIFRERVVGLHLKNKFYEFATKAEEQYNCPCCLNDIKQAEAFCLLVCGHHTCTSCWIYMSEPKRCPVCRE